MSVDLPKSLNFVILLDIYVTCIVEDFYPSDHLKYKQYFALHFIGEYVSTLVNVLCKLKSAAHQKTPLHTHKNQCKSIQSYLHPNY